MNYKLKIVLMTLSAAAVIFGGVLALVPKKAEAALTESQIQAILDLLQSFGTDQAIVGNVNSSLRGLPTTGGGGGTAAFCPNFTYNLYLGLNDSETEGQATQLQKFLAQDSIVYPEGHITGFYGPLTEQAVKRWQAKNGLVSSGSPDTTGYGVMGVQTREKIRAFCPTSLPISIPPQTCPQYSSPFCQANEKITPGGMDASGCQLPGKCVPAGTSLPPVISGVSGPTALNTSQSGTWTVTARDPENSPLSYSVVWGDEVSYPTPLRTPSASESVKQTATFTHTYSGAGVYTPIFYVMDSQGLSAKTSISVNVGGAVVSQGSLYISPSDPTIKVGQKMNLQALQEEIPYPVKARWISSNPSVVSVEYMPTLCATPPAQCYDTKTAVISGLAAGTASISATYQLPSGTTLTAKTQVNIQSDSQPSISVDLKVNGSDDPITATPTQNLSVTWSVRGFTSGLATCSFSNYPVGSSLGSQSALSGSDSISFSAVTPPRSVNLTVTCFDGLRTTTDSVPSASDSVTINIIAPSLTQPSVTVISPNGGESWAKGTGATIKWSSPPSFVATYGDVTLTNYSVPCDPKTQLCALMPSVLYTLAKSVLLGNGSFSWKVGYDINSSDIPAGQYIIRVTDSSSGASDSSDAAFDIQ